MSYKFDKFLNRGREKDEISGSGGVASSFVYSAIANHNTASNAHSDTFDEAGTAKMEVELHNSDEGAHFGHLLPFVGENGSLLVVSGGTAAWKYGDTMQAVTGSFTAKPGTVYALDLAENKTIYIEAVGNADFDFWLVVTMGATRRSLTLLPDMVSAILWSDGGTPPDYSAANHAPALDTTLATYTIRFRYIAAENAFHAELAATKDYNLPISGVRGVFTSSGSTPVASAMVVSGGILGTGGTATAMNVYSRGGASEVAVSSGGSMTVSSGGVATSAVVTSGGYAYVYEGGFLNGATTYAGGSAIVSSGGVASDLVQSGGALIIASSGTAVGGRFINVVTVSVQAFAQGYMQTGGIMYLTGTSLDGTMTGGRIFVSNGGLASSLAISGGSAVVSAGGIASAPTVLSGGTLIVSSAGVALDVTSSAGAVVTVLEGGTITYKE